MKYHELQRYAFKRFSVLSALSTALPTAQYFATRKPLPASKMPALCTMNILPPLVTVWHHFARKFLGNRINIIIFDCSGKLKANDFPGTRVLPFLNLYASTKCEEFLYHIAKNHRIGWICDDDVFLINPKAVDIVEQELKQPNTASVSFFPRPGWEFTIDGTAHPASSSYCTAINREIFCNKERLSLAPVDGNVHNPDGNGKPRRFDTFDRANELLLQKGYNCFVIPESERENYIIPFHGISNAVMLLSCFRTSKQTLDYFINPPKKKWNGNILYRAFAGMLVISQIQDMATSLKGEAYPIPSLPSKKELQKVRSAVEPYLREGHSFLPIDAAAERLRALI